MQLVTYVYLKMGLLCLTFGAVLCAIVKIIKVVQSSLVTQ